MPPLANVKIVTDAVEVLRAAIETYLQGLTPQASYIDVIMIGHNFHKLMLMHVLDGNPPLTPQQAATIIVMSEQRWVKTTSEMVLKLLGRLQARESGADDQALADEGESHDSQ